MNFETITTDEIENEHYSANPTNRCYFCKSELYEKLSAIAAERDIKFVLDGTNADDLIEIRPGRIAAQEKLVRSPLAEVGLTKDEIRAVEPTSWLVRMGKTCFAVSCVADSIRCSGYDRAAFEGRVG